MAFNRFKFGGKVKEADLKRIEDNIDLMEKSRDAFRRYLARILKSKMYLDGIDEDADTMDTLIGRIDDLGGKWIIEDNKKFRFPDGCSWTDIREDMYMDSVVVYCRKNIIENNIDLSSYTFTKDEYIDQDTGDIVHGGEFDDGIFGFAIENYIPVIGNTLYKFSTNSSNSSGAGGDVDTITIAFYDLNKRFLYSVFGEHSLKFKTPDNCAFIRFDIVQYDTLTTDYITITSERPAYDNYGQIQIKGRYLEIVGDPKLVITNKNRTLETINDRYFDYTIDASSMSGIAEADGGAYFTIYFDPDSHTNGVELKIDGDCVEWVCFNTTFPILLDLGNHTAKRVENIACGPIIMRIKDNDTLEQVVGIRFRTDSQIIAFENCTALNLIDNVDMSYTNPYYRFEGCTSMETAPNFNTSNCSRLDQLFKGCTSLTNISELNMSACKNAREMFMGPIGLTTADVNDKLINASALEIAERMFANTDIDAEIASFENMRNADGMYEDNVIPSGDMAAMTFNGGGTSTSPAVVSVKNMFAFTQASVIKASGEDMLTNVGTITTTNCSLDADGLYKGRTKLTTDNLGLTASTKIHGANSMFEGCTGLTTLPVADFSECTRYSYMYKGCSNIVDNSNITMEFGNLEWTAAYPASEAIFDGCKNITGTLTINNMRKPYDFFLTSGGCPTAEAPKFTAVTFNNMTEDVAGCKIAVHNQNMDADALNAMFNSLADVNTKNTERGVQSYIIIEGNPGAATCDTTIATNKGWTIATLLDLMVKLATVVITDTGISSMSISSTNGKPVPYCNATFKAGKSTELLCESRPYTVPTEREAECASLRQLYEVDIYGWDDFTSINFFRQSGGNNNYMIYCDYLNVTNKANSLANLCRSCSNLKYVNTANWDVSNVTDMSSMFESCWALTNIDGLSNWDVSKVTNMSGIFRFCNNSGLTTLDVSKWNTSNVENMSYMFNGCFYIENLDVSKWDTSKVTSMCGLFYNCESIKELNVSNWDVSNVTDMSYMFNGCYKKLTALDVSNWNTSNVENMSYMFNKCRVLLDLDVSNWDVSKVTNMRQMFERCIELPTLNMTKWVTSKVTNMQAMFNDCYKLNTIGNVINWDTGNVENMTSMFQNCKLLDNLSLSGWNTSKVTDMSEMFSQCNKLNTLDISTWNVNKVTNMRAMFDNNTGLLSLDLSGWNTSSVTNMQSMFNFCTKLTTLNLTNWNMDNVTNTTGMFANCSALTQAGITMPTHTATANKIKSIVTA